MKILHVSALVGHLAVTALSFYPFTFASPLAAIDHDGYVNTTQNHIDSALMEHVLGSIVETTEDYSDSGALIKHVPSVIEARQLDVIDVVIIIDIVAAVTSTILWIRTDDPKRAAYTQGVITKTFAQYPTFNWIICHSPYSVAFDGVEGTDWGHTHHELGISFFRTIGYDLYWAKSGTFYRYGDGGFINWAYNGNILGTDDGGATVHFGTIS